MLAHLFRFRHDGPVAEADERAGAEGNRPRSGRAAALLGLGRCARLRDGEARSPLEAAGAGVGPSRSRHRPPSTWINESSPIPSDERRVAIAAEAGADQDGSGGESGQLPSPTSPEGRERSRGYGGRSGRSGPELGGVQNGLARIPILYEGRNSYLVGAAENRASFRSRISCRHRHDQTGEAGHQLRHHSAGPHHLRCPGSWRS